MYVKDCRKSILNVINTEKQQVEEKGLVVLNQVKILEGQSIDFKDNASTIELNTPGNYLVTVTAVIELPEGPDPVMMQLEDRGVPLKDSWGGTDYNSVMNLGTITFTSVLRVKPGCPMIDNRQRILLRNTGCAVTYVTVNVVVTKIV